MFWNDALLCHCESDGRELFVGSPMGSSPIKYSGELMCARVGAHAAVNFLSDPDFTKITWVSIERIRVVPLSVGDVVPHLTIVLCRRYSARL